MSSGARLVWGGGRGGVVRGFTTGNCRVAYRDVICVAERC